MTYRLFDEMEYLKGRLKFLDGETRHLKGRIEIVEQSLFSSLTVVDGLPVIVAHIIYQCAIEYGVDVERMREFSDNRVTDINTARSLAIYRIMELGKFKITEVAAWFNITVPAATAARGKGKALDSPKKDSPKKVKA